VRDFFDRITPAGYITVSGETQARITRITAEADAARAGHCGMKLSHASLILPTASSKNGAKLGAHVSPNTV
jgi:hypothetical protein